MSGTSQKRHIAKTITWRIVGTIDTILLSWFISGNPLAGLKIGFSEVITKMLLYYLHERVWFKMKFPDSRKRHILKTLTWRFVGTLDTMMIAWFITGDPMTGLKIGSAEVITKMLLYYLHERVWYKIDFGLEKRSH
ncbi:DUF2061 domain-containing protein [Robertkochia solimangrovi]|uniref:DUF2061 domain-containing protein n=1 Tax=Robertkochia solimangrovi TaxID=2213046 RepID=UPI00117CB8C2|nr:DUF2061 domain-containing protein [Robertkochia solimangrovi]TRZ46032.1 DUF2061 domain-containing protein [Robertkochia solimangrovi]